jgi:hypothetical protein
VVAEEKAYGLASQHELIHPDWLLFVDEYGSNTLQAKDGQVGGQKFLCSIEGRLQERATTKDAHVTVLGFTAASGEDVMCAAAPNLVITTRIHLGQAVWGKENKCLVIPAAEKVVYFGNNIERLVGLP